MVPLLTTGATSPGSVTALEPFSLVPSLSGPENRRVDVELAVEVRERLLALLDLLDDIALELRREQPLAIVLSGETRPWGRSPTSAG